jgi:MFS family permease
MMKKISEHVTPYAWLVWFACALFLFYKYILQVYPSIITQQLMAEFNLTGLGLGNLAAYFYYSYLVTQLFVGVLLDKYSPRLLTTLAISLCAIGVLLFGLTHSLLVAAIARTMIGVGVAFSTVSYMKMTSLWFPPKKFAFVCGLLATASMLGAVFGQTPLSWVVATNGWRHALIYCAVLGFAIAAFFLCIAKDRQLEQAESHLEKQALKFADFLIVFKNKQNWLLTFYSGLAFSPIAVFGGLWGNPFLVEAYNITTTQAASLITCSFIGLAAGGPFLGLLSNQLGKRKPTMYLGTLLSFICLAIVIYSQHISFIALGILLFVFGFGIGSFMLGFTVGREINPLALTATVIALINTGDALVNSITEPLIGKLLDTHWSGKIVNGAHYFVVENYHFALGLLPVYLFAALILLFFLKETHCKQD